MRRLMATVIPTILLFAFPAAAQQTAIETEVITVGEDEQALRQSILLDASAATVWAHFTDADYVSRWMAPVAEVDLRSGGTIRTNYEPCAQIGTGNTITLNIVSLVPERILILQTDLSAQRGASWLNDAILERAPHMANLITFEAVGDDRTRVTSWGLGYGRGEEWEQITGFFIAGNEWSFGQLQRALAGEDVYPDCEE